MVRAMSYLLSFWLLTLFVVGQNLHVPQGIVALVGLGGLFAAIGGMMAPLVGARLRLFAPLALGAGLVALGAVGLAMNVEPWLPGTLFMGAFSYAAIVVAEVLWSPRNRGTMAPTDS